jgi:hypothetical protein
MWNKAYEAQEHAPSQSTLKSRPPPNPHQHADIFERNSVPIQGPLTRIDHHCDQHRLQVADCGGENGRPPQIGGALLGLAHLSSACSI